MMDFNLWIKTLMDEGSFVPLAQAENTLACGMGLMQGRPVCCMLLAGPTEKADDRADALVCSWLERVSQLAMPVVMLACTASLPKACRLLARLSGVCPIIGIPAAQADALLCALCDVRIHWGKIDAQASCVDLCAQDEPAAVELLRNLLSLLPANCAEDAPIMDAPWSQEQDAMHLPLGTTLHRCVDPESLLECYAGSEGTATLGRVNGRVSLLLEGAAQGTLPQMQHLISMADAYSLPVIMAMESDMTQDAALFYTLAVATTVKIAIGAPAQPCLFDMVLPHDDELHMRLSAALEVLSSKREVLLPHKHGNMLL